MAWDLSTPTGLNLLDHFIDLSERDIFSERTSMLTKADSYSGAATMAGYGARYSMLAGDIGAASTLIRAPFQYARAYGLEQASSAMPEFDDPTRDGSLYS